jgi:hypothetical protein
MTISRSFRLQGESASNLPAPNGSRAERKLNVKRIKLAVIGAALAGVIGIQAMSGGVAVAHNAGHVILPNGTCLNVGSGKAAPFE